MPLKISQAQKEDHSDLIEIWERSVRATHHFLNEEDINHFKPMIRDKYFDAVALFNAKIERDTIGFLGLTDSTVEMLFIDPPHFRKGYGKKMLKYAVYHHDCTFVDVNEQNTGAVAFYSDFGFEIKSRSEVDPQGKPYPILHMELEI